MHKRMLFLLRVFILIIFTFSSMPVPASRAASGDGRIVYGANASGSDPQTRSYTVSGGNWSTTGGLGAANTVINYVIVKASPQDDEYVAGIVTSTGPTLYVYTYSGGSWSQSWSASVPSVSYQVFDIEYEQDSGDCLVVYSNGGTSNEISYRARVNGSWDGSSTTLESNRTTGVARFVELEARPGSDEIAMAFSDANADVNAFIWSGSGWGSEPAALLTTAAKLDLATVRSFDVAYEQNSGDVLIAYSIAAAAGCGLAVKLAGQATWTNTADEGALLDQATAIDLASEPGSDYIAFSSISDATRDLQLAVWVGTDTSPFNFQYTDTDADTAAATWAVPRQPVANGWAGSGSNRRAVFVYRDVAATTLQYFTWKKDTQAWEQADDSPATYSPPVSSNAKNFIFTDQDKNSSAKLWVTAVDGGSDLWTFTFDAASATTNWATVDTGAGGNNPLEGTTTTAVNGCADAAFTAYDPTLVELTGFRAQTQGNAARVSWLTAAEVRTRGFRIYRTFLPAEPDSYEEVSAGERSRTADKIIPARGNHFSGRRYSIVDRDAPPGIYYILEEVLKSGGVKRYGPVRLDDETTFIGAAGTDKNTVIRHRDGTLEIDGNVVSPRVKPFGKKNRRHGESPQSTVHSPRKHLHSPHNNTLKIEVNEEGIYRITADDLTNAGWDISAIDPRRLSMSNKDKEIPLYFSGGAKEVFESNDYIEFYGKPETSRYTGIAMYWLSELPGRRGLRIGEEEPAAWRGKITDYYRALEHREDESEYYPEFHGDAHWFFSGEFIAADGVLSRYDFTVNLDHIDRGHGAARIALALQGASQMGFGRQYNRQKALVFLNGVSLGEAVWQDDVPYIFSREIPVDLIAEGENTITIEASSEGAGFQQFFLLDWIEVTYPRALFARGGSLIFDAPAGHNAAAFAARGFASADIEAFAVRREGVTRVKNPPVTLEPEGDYSVILTDPDPAGARYLVSAGSAIRSPLAVYPDKVSALARRDNQADYIIIAHDSFLEAAQQLADYRRLQGLQVMVVDVQDIYDEFNAGIFSPAAIRKFLSYTHRNWRSPAPLFVLLVGDATFDYRDFWQMGYENLVPAYLVDTPDFGETVSDSWFVDFNDDFLPEMLIGRLPVRSVEETSAVIEKIIGYEQAFFEPWMKKLIFAADAQRSFEETADALAGLAPEDYSAEKLYLSAMPSSDIRQSLIDGINSGALIFDYTGHAGVSLLGSDSIFDNGDVESLANSPRYPVFFAQDCLSGYFIYPEGMNALSEVFLTAYRPLTQTDVELKGAAACISPSGLSSVLEQRVFSEGFYAALFDKTKPPVLGGLLYAAQKHLSGSRSLIGSTNKVDNILRTYNLLGDPALLVRRDDVPAAYSPQLISGLHNLLHGEEK